jgi:type I restriction enzyme, S subunit
VEQHNNRAVCRLINGKAFKPSDWSTDDGLPIVRIQNLNRKDADFNYYRGQVDDKFMIDSGQLLFAWSGTPGTSFGAHIWQGPKAVLNQHIFKVVPNETVVDKHYLQYAINQTLEEQIDRAPGLVCAMSPKESSRKQSFNCLPSMSRAVSSQNSTA